MYRGTKETIGVSCCDRMSKMTTNKRTAVKISKKKWEFLVKKIHPRYVALSKKNFWLNQNFFFKFFNLMGVFHFSEMVSKINTIILLSFLITIKIHVANPDDKIIFSPTRMSVHYYLVGLFFGKLGSLTTTTASKKQ